MSDMTLAQTRIGFIGGGNMAYAIVGGLLQAEHSAACIHVSDPSAEQLQRFEDLNPGCAQNRSGAQSNA